MPRRFELRTAALRDLAGVRRYTLEEFGPQQAERYLAGLRQKLQLLAEMPEISPAVAVGSSIRMGLFKSHRILYRESAYGIEVGRILHQAQDFVRALAAYSQLVRGRESRGR